MSVRSLATISVGTLNGDRLPIPRWTSRVTTFTTIFILNYILFYSPVRVLLILLLLILSSDLSQKAVVTTVTYPHVIVIFMVALRKMLYIRRQISAL